MISTKDPPPLGGGGGGHTPHKEGQLVCCEEWYGGKVLFRMKKGNRIAKFPKGFVSFSEVSSMERFGQSNDFI